MKTKHISNFSNFLLKDIGLLEYGGFVNILHRMLNANNPSTKLKYYKKENYYYFKPCDENNFTSLRISNNFSNILDSLEIPYCCLEEDWFEIEKKWLINLK